MMLRTGVYAVLICLGSNPELVDQVHAGTLLSNRSDRNHVSRPPRTIPKLGPSARVPMPHARPQGASPTPVGTKPESDSQRVPLITSPSATTNNNSAAPAEPAAVTFPPVTPLE